jgi:hypothetical protein
VPDPRRSLVGLKVDWNRLARVGVPEAIRRSVERRLLVLWRFLDCARAATLFRAHGRCRSEPFRIHEEQWTFTYRIDLSSGAAVVDRVLDRDPAW